MPVLSTAVHPLINNLIWALFQYAPVYPKYRVMIWNASDTYAMNKFYDIIFMILSYVICYVAEFLRDKRSDVEKQYLTRDINKLDSEIMTVTFQNPNIEITHQAAIFISFHDNVHIIWFINLRLVQIIAHVSSHCTWWRHQMETSSA